MTLYEIFKIIHILAASAWVGGVIVTQIQATRALASGGAPLEHFMWEQQKIGPKFFAPMSLTVVIAGVVMVFDHGGIDFEDTWIVIGIAGFLATFITGLFVLKPRVEKIIPLMEGRSPSDPEVQPKIAELIKMSRIDLVVLVLIVIDMVVKPGA